MSVLPVLQRIGVSDPPYAGLRDNVCDSFLGRWKARKSTSAKLDMFSINIQRTVKRFIRLTRKLY